MLLLNQRSIEITTFPDNTTQVWKIDPTLLDSSQFYIDWDFSSEAELLHLAQLKALLDTYRRPVTLHIHYLPYARQDKDISNEATFALRPFAKLLNVLSFNKIIIDDPHSTIATKCIERSNAVYPTDLVQKIKNLLKIDLVCYPDKGARSRYSSIYPFESIYGEKIRDQSSGRILSYDVVGNPDGKNILIIDDICDGGATFIVLAQDLFARGANTVDLFVTHGLFSKGLNVLQQSGIRHIFTKKGEAYESSGKINYKEISL